MSKLFDALKKSQPGNGQPSPKPAPKKSQPVNGQPSPKPAPKKVIRISHEAVDALRLDTTAVQRPRQVSSLPRGNIDSRLASFLEPGSLSVQSFKILRAKILTMKSNSRLRTIMVTSPQPMDGKTIVATNLAITIAQGINEHVLLVDCDLRRPSINRLLGLNAQVGISEYLNNGASLGPYLLKTHIEKLTVLPAGKPSPNPSEQLSSEKMRQLVEELRDRYEDRYIIFDATPAQFAAEVTFMASMVDGVLLVVRSGKTPRDSVMGAIENIDRNKIIGVVFNASNKSPKDYKDYYKYYREAADS